MPSDNPVHALPAAGGLGAGPAIELITDDALEQLNRLSRQARAIKAAVGYWALPPGQLDPAFVRGLSHPEGFLCCDIHSPTSIGALEQFCYAGARMYLYLFQLVGRTEVADSKGIADHLMHSKVLIFEDDSTHCVIWVGSHNGTARAIRGINHECAVLLRMPKTSQVYLDLCNELAGIRNLSSPFDLNDVEYYRLLQGLSNAEGFIEAVDEQPGPLARGTTVTFFGTDLGDYAALKSVGRRIFLALTQRGSGIESIYRSSITQTGELDAEANGSVQFGKRRYAFRQTRHLPVLHPLQEVPAQVYRQARFFVTLRVEEMMANVEALESPPEQLWESMPVQAYLSERRHRRGNLPEGSLGTGRRVSIQQAVGRQGGSGADAARWERAFELLPLAAKLSMQDHPLVRRRILRVKPSAANADSPDADTQGG